LKDGFRRLLVFGCLAERYRDELLKGIPEIDGIWGVGEEEKIIGYCKGIREARAGEGRGEGSVNPPPILLTPPSYAYLKIAEGCDRRCTFCVIPSIRGRFKSYSPDEILREAEGLIKKGIREIIIVAQDITRYGKGLRGYSLASLLQDIVSISGEFYIRLLYLYPTGITDELIDCINGNEKIIRYLDIPFQHSEDRIIRMMGRSGSRKEYIRLIKKLRRDIPGVVLRTTIMVGFPTETEEEFKALVDFIEEGEFERLGVFRYSAEERTPASRLKPQVPGGVKDRRYDEIMRVQSLISYKKNRALIGGEFKAIIDGFDDGSVIARLYSHAPEIDGVVIIKNRAKKGRVPSLPSIGVGDVVTVRIVDADEYDLKGVLC